jgi:uncharacterized membrane protein YdbT with pleckstrin-like domain
MNGSPDEAASLPPTPSSDEQLIWKGHSSAVVHFGTFLLCGLFCWLVVPIFIGLWKWIQNRCRVYEITTERIKISQGVFSRSTEEVELYRVRDYRLEEPFWIRMFHLGNIVLATTDNTNQGVVIEAIPDADELRNQIRKHVELCRLRKNVHITELEQ